MKRFLVVVMLLVMVSTSAYADYDKEITFRDLPMGSSIEDVRSKLLEEGVSPTYFKFEDMSMGSFFSDYYEEKYPYIDIDDGGYVVTIYDPGDLRLAGYEISFLSMDFMYKIVDGVSIKNQENAGLTKAYYSIKAIDQLAVYADLKQKLTKLYGTPVERNEKTTFINDEDRMLNMAIWYGANDTAAYIVCEWFTQDGVTKIPKDYIGDSSVNVCYGKPNTYETFELLKKYEEQLAFEEEQKKMEESVDDTTGL